MTKWVYGFGDGTAEGSAEMRDLLGGKGAGLAEMSNLGLPVPPGFIITTDVCTAYYGDEHKLPDDLAAQVGEALNAIEASVGAGFGDAKNPLLVSVRSGARASMPGMLDTILNLGLNGETVAGLARKADDERFAFDSYRRFIQMYSNVVLGVSHDVFEELLDRSETMTRHSIEAIPDGVYSYVDYLDNDGIELDKEIEIHAAVTVRGSNIHIDFAGTSPQVKGPFNCVRSGSLAAAYFALRAVTDPAIPTNGGCFRPVTLDLPEGSLLCPRDGAPVNARTSTIKRVASCILGALRRALSDRLPADNGGEMLLLAFGGQRPGGANYVVGEMIASGSGASAARDGVDMIETDCTNCMNLPVEAMEMDAPIRILRSELRRDSGGLGAHRGGLGLRREYEILDGDVVLTYRGERHRRPALGADGGGAGATARGVITRRDGTVEEIPSKCVTLLQAGDRLLIETAGGGGYGDPAGRSQAARRCGGAVERP